MARRIRYYCDHRHIKLLEKLATELGPRWQNRWEREQKKKRKIEESKR